MLAHASFKLRAVFGTELCAGCKMPCAPLHATTACLLTYPAMLQMQACGEPPKEIVNEMAPGLALDSQGQPQLPSGLGGALGGLGGLSGLSGSGSGPANCCIQ